MALLCTVDVVSIELRAVRPVLDPLSMLLVIFPEASEVATIFVQVVAEAMRFVIHEIALINVSI